MTFADPWALAVERLAPRSAEVNLLINEQIARRAHAVSSMPIWSNGRRPDFWGDLEVRLILTAAHRQTTLAEVLLMIEALLGADRRPSRSAAHRYWQVLDRAPAI